MAKVQRLQYFDSIFRNLGVHAQLELMREDTALTEQVA